jgi:hypothetical protein
VLEKQRKGQEKGKQNEKKKKTHLEIPPKSKREEVTEVKPYLKRRDEQN